MTKDESFDSTVLLLQYYLHLPRISAAAVVVVVVIVAGVIEGAASAVGFGIAAPAAAAAAFFLAVFLGGPEELEGVSSYLVIAA